MLAEQGSQSLFRHYETGIEGYKVPDCGARGCAFETRLIHKFEYFACCFVARRNKYRLNQAWQSSKVIGEIEIINDFTKIAMVYMSTYQF